MATRQVRLTQFQSNKRNWPWLESGIYLTTELVDASARFEVETAQGSFSFSATQVQWGAPLWLLDGRVVVERVALTEQLTNTIEEQDFPALAVTSDRAYLAYVEFTHGDRSQRLPRQLRQKPATYESLNRPAGGDQVLLREYHRSIETWGPPEAVLLPARTSTKQPW